MAHHPKNLVKTLLKGLLWIKVDIHGYYLSSSMNDELR